MKQTQDWVALFIPLYRSNLSIHNLPDELSITTIELTETESLIPCKTS